MKLARLIVLVLALAAGAVAAWLASGGRRPDHVDVVLTQKLNGNQGFKSQIILSNVRVLAVDQVLGEKDGQKVIVGKTATIEADPSKPPYLRTPASWGRRRSRYGACSIREQRPPMQIMPHGMMMLSLWSVTESRHRAEPAPSPLTPLPIPSFSL